MGEQALQDVVDGLGRLERRYRLFADRALELERDRAALVAAAREVKKRSRWDVKSGYYMVNREAFRDLAALVEEP